MEEIKIGCIELHKLFSILRLNFQNGAKTLNRNRLGGENRMCLQKDLGFIVVKESLLGNNGRDQNRVHKARQVADILMAPRQQSDPVHVGWL